MNLSIDQTVYELQTKHKGSLPKKMILEENTDEGRGEIAFWQKEQTHGS